MRLNGHPAAVSSLINMNTIANTVKEDYSIAIRQIARRTIFLFKIRQNFTLSSNFMMSQKLKPLFRNISIQRLKIQKQNPLKILESQPTSS